MGVADHDQIDLQFVRQTADFAHRVAGHQMAFGGDAALAKGNGRVIPVQVLRGQETRILYLERYWLTETP